MDRIRRRSSEGHSRSRKNRRSRSRSRSRDEDEEDEGKSEQIEEEDMFNAEEFTEMLTPPTKKLSPKDEAKQKELMQKLKQINAQKSDPAIQQVCTEWLETYLNKILILPATQSQSILKAMQSMCFDCATRMVGLFRKITHIQTDQGFLGICTYMILNMFIIRLFQRVIPNFINLSNWSENERTLLGKLLNLDNVMIIIELKPDKQINGIFCLISSLNLYNERCFAISFLMFILFMYNIFTIDQILRGKQIIPAGTAAIAMSNIGKPGIVNKGVFIISLYEYLQKILEGTPPSVINLEFRFQHFSKARNISKDILSYLDKIFIFYKHMKDSLRLSYYMVFYRHVRMIDGSEYWASHVKGIIPPGSDLPTGFSPRITPIIVSGEPFHVINKSKQEFAEEFMRSIEYIGRRMKMDYKSRKILYIMAAVKLQNIPGFTHVGIHSAHSVIFAISFIRGKISEIKMLNSWGGNKSETLIKKDFFIECLIKSYIYDMIIINMFQQEGDRYRYYMGGKKSIKKSIQAANFTKRKKITKRK